MDLREKPSKIQNMLEILLRVRLIAVVVLVVATVTFLAKNWQGVVSLPLGASEAFGMWFAEIENLQSAWASSQFIVVASIACVVLFAVFGGLRGAVASVVSAALALLGLFLMGGSESLVLPMFGIVALVSLVMVIFAKLSVACSLFPFVISWLFLGGLVAVLPATLEPSWLVWGVLSAMGFASAMALSAVAGRHLSAGMPQAGALVKAAKQVMVPVVIGSLLLVAAVAFDMPSVEVSAEGAAETPSSNVPGALLYFAVFNIWFFAFLFPILSFAPWDRLRSESRRVEMKDKKKPTKKGFKKK